MNVFDRALEMLEQDGWTQGVSQAPDGSMCLGEALGRAEAIEAAGDYSPVRPNPLMWMQDVVLGRISIPVYNDFPGRLFSHIRVALLAASAAWEEQNMNIGEVEEEVVIEPLTVPPVVVPAEPEPEKVPVG